MSTTQSGMTSDAINQLIAQRVAEELTAHEANQNNGNGNRNGGRNRNEANGNAGGVVQATRGCTYKALINCQHHKFSRTEGVVCLARWFKKMELVFHISNCATYCQVKFAKCTLIDGALTWNEIQKMENELWNLTVKGNDVVGYTRRFKELALL
ncbi:hypothetical protein Tco_1269037, partial [Tanacetum coccineum]